MKLATGGGMALGRGEPKDQLTYIKEAERLGYDSLWVAEIYGSDAPTVTSYIAAHTERINLGTGIMQMYARTPAMAAMTAATLDALSGGRFLLGLGLSGPQVVEGWYGQRYESPIGYTREYVEIVRKIFSREEPLTYDGKYFKLPVPGSQGKPLKLILHPVRDRIPIYLASIGPKNLELTGAIADGWLPALFSPDHMEAFLPHLEKGAKRAGRSIDEIDICAGAGVAIGDDIAALISQIKPGLTFYLGGMGSRKDNFYNRLATRYGYADEAKRIQDLFLAGDRAGALAATPDDLVDATSLVGPKERIAERLKRYEAAGVTTLMVNPRGESLKERIEVLEFIRDLVA